MRDLTFIRAMMTPRHGDASKDGQLNLRANDRARWLHWCRALCVLGGIALSYLLTAKASLLLAIPPGYATAVWPPAGISLAALLMYGARYAPGVWLGSFVTNLAIALDTSSTESTVRSLLLAATIGLGAAAQALAGMLLVRRLGTFSPSLRKDNEVFSFLLLGGPLACMVNASIGVGALFGAGAIPASATAYSWATWWVGDTIGVLIFAPLTVMWLGPSDAWRNRRLIITGPLTLTFVAAVLVFVETSAAEREKLKERFDEDSALLLDALSRQVDYSREKVTAVRALLTSHPELSREQFARFAEVILADVPELRGVSWVARVDAEDRPAFEAALKAAGVAPLGITEYHATGTLIHAANRASYTPVTYIFPLEKNSAALGFDLSSQAARRDALVRAAAADAIQVTAPIRLVQGERPYAGVLLAGRVSDPARMPDPGEPGRNLTRGFVTLVFEPHQLATAAFESSRARSYIRVTIEDRGVDVQEHTLHAPSDPDDGADALGLSHERTLKIGDRTWTLTFSPTLKYIALSKSPLAWLVLALGLTVCALFGAGALVLTGRTALVERVVQQRTVQLAEKVEQHVRAERELEEERSFLKAVLENLHEGIIVLDDVGRISLTNESARAMEGLLNGVGATFEGHAALALLEPDGGRTLSRAELPFARALAGEIVRDVELAADDASGRKRVFVVTCQPLRPDPAHVDGAVCVVRDITESRAAERLKREFVSTVSHELRTPLTSIHGALSLLRGGAVGAVDPEAMELVELGMRNAERLLDLINDLLDMDKLEAGLMSFEHKKLPLWLLLKQSVENNLSYALAHNVSLSLGEADDITDTWVNVDPSRFLQVLANLVSNAIKFSTAGGKVEITGQLEGARVRVAVRDQGPGIPEDFRSRIFQKFSQADGSDTKAKGGTGLGLSITKGLVERMGGSIDFRTTMGVGTTFFVEFPTVAAPSITCDRAS